MKRFVLFGVVLAATFTLDQLTKLWAARTLQHGCTEVGREGPGEPPRVASCRDRGLVVRLSEPASRLTLGGLPAARWVASCAQGRACLSGEVRIGEAPEGASAEGAAPVLQPGAVYTVSATSPRGTAALRFAFARPGPMIEVIPGYLDLEWAENRGAAFSFLANAPGIREPILIGIAVLASLFLLWMAWRLKPGQHLLAAALALVLAGAVGNLVDRIRLSYVIDFIAFHIRDGFRWPTFNVADAAIVVGVAMLLIDSIRGWLRERKAKKAAK